ncbi:MAG: MBL fold metallo-hydrolase [Oscillospiraceae bacterium]|nr:MBL fold metallo-hydrolase [Oscillospiraceae bacterium]
MARLRRGNGRKSSKNATPFSILLIIIAIVLAWLVSNAGWDPISDFLGLNQSPKVLRAAEGTVQVHFLDVGQGDCALIITEDKAVLIDSGEAEYADKVIQYIRKMGVSSLDLIVVSHPHSDHMGGMSQIIKTINTDRMIMPKLPEELIPTNNTFDGMIIAIEDNTVQAGTTPYGECVDIELGGATLEIFAPVPNDGFDGLNDYSIVVRLIHGENSFLFTGDIEKAAEKAILEKGFDISATVLKVAHHGSKTSSRIEFLSDVGGEYAVISVGSPNRYNHPTTDVLERLDDMHYSILRTDQAGTIVFESKEDGTLNIVRDRESADNEWRDAA